MTRHLLALLLIAGCAAPGEPDLATPSAVVALERMQEEAARGAWAALAAAEVPDCGGPRDAVCAARQALRARGCAAEAERSETARRRLLDCAVESGAAALAASDATPPEIRHAWRGAWATALFRRRQARPGVDACDDNTLLLAVAETLRVEDPASPWPRFLAASARLTAVVRRCDPAMGCAALAEARALLRDPPAEAAPEWRALAVGVAQVAMARGC
jgi:hypothetical protein